MGRIVKDTGQDTEMPATATAATSSFLDRDKAAAEVAALLASARATANAERAAVKDAAIVLARKMAEKIIGRALELDPSLMGDIATQAFAASRPREGLVWLRVHPDDMAAVESAKPGMSARLANAADVRIVADISVGRHACVVETPAGRLDARLQTQLDALEQALLSVGRGRP
jgi:flagellar biosynthesis/type III secretory pathway protein FliH